MQILIGAAPAGSDLIRAERYDADVGLVVIEVPKTTPIGDVLKEIEAAILRRQLKGS